MLAKLVFYLKEYIGIGYLAQDIHKKKTKLTKLAFNYTFKLCFSSVFLCLKVFWFVCLHLGAVTFECTPGLVRSVSLITPQPAVKSAARILALALAESAEQATRLSKRGSSEPPTPISLSSSSEPTLHTSISSSSTDVLW